MESPLNVAKPEGRTRCYLAFSAPRLAYARPLRPGSQPFFRAMPRAPKSPAGITAQAAQDEASELGKQRSKSPGNQSAPSTASRQRLLSTPTPYSLHEKPQKSCQLIDGRRYRDTARANTAGHQQNGSGNSWRSRPNGHPRHSRQRNSLHQSPKKSPAEARPPEAAKTLTKRRPPPAASRPTAARRRPPPGHRARASRRSARPPRGRRARKPR